MRTNEEVDSIYTKEELLKKISTVRLWAHKIQLGSHVVTPGIIHDKIMQKELDAIPKDLTGKSVLDVGARNGGWAFECERRNAKEITAIDVWQNEGPNGIRDEPFKICKEILDSKVELIELDVLDIEKLGKKFDIILFLGVIYHLMDPLLALRKLYNVCNELVILQGAVLKSPKSICYFLEPGELGGDTSNTFLISPIFIENYAKSIGFRKAELVEYVEGESLIPSDKKNSDKNNPQLKRSRAIMYLWK